LLSRIAKSFKSFAGPLLSRIAKVLLSRIAKIVNGYAILESKVLLSWIAKC
jgi:hypothetical protein